MHNTLMNICEHTYLSICEHFKNSVQKMKLKDKFTLVQIYFETNTVFSYYISFMDF